MPAMSRLAAAPPSVPMKQGTNSNTEQLKRTAAGSFLSRGEKDAYLVFYRFVPCNCLILVSERVSDLIRAFPSIKAFMLFLLPSLSHKTGGQNWGRTSGVSHLCFLPISTTPANLCTPSSCAPSGLFEMSQQVQKSYEE